MLKINSRGIACKCEIRFKGYAGLAKTVLAAPVLASEPPELALSG